MLYQLSLEAGQGPAMPAGLDNPPYVILMCHCRVKARIGSLAP